MLKIWQRGGGHWNFARLGRGILHKTGKWSIAKTEFNFNRKNATKTEII